jgi:hypothetical protein
MNPLRLLPRTKPQVGLSPGDLFDKVGEDLGVKLTRGRMLGDDFLLGKNIVHLVIKRGPSGIEGKPGTYEDLGWFANLKTTVGMDWIHEQMGGVVAPTQNGPATVVTATAVTGTGSTWTAGTLAGKRIWMPVTGLTTAPVYGNILSNTTTVAQIDQWWTSADGVGTTPANSNAFQIAAGGLASARFIGLSNDGTAPAVGNTAMVSEIVANGLNRALATFAHTGGTTTFTQTKTWTCATAPQAAQIAGLLTGGYGASGGGILVLHTQFTSASLQIGDSLQLTWTITLPAAS